MSTAESPPDRQSEPDSETCDPSIEDTNGDQSAVISFSIGYPLIHPRRCSRRPTDCESAASQTAGNCGTMLPSPLTQQSNTDTIESQCATNNRIMPVMSRIARHR